MNEDFKLIRKILGNSNKSRIILGFRKSTELHGIARVKFLSACVKAIFFLVAQLGRYVASIELEI
jgi:hypothetical protein